jgi:hypothetical protein
MLDDLWSLLLHLLLLLLEGGETLFNRCFLFIQSLNIRLQLSDFRLALLVQTRQ